MSSEIAVRARGLSKSYAIFERPQDRLKQMFVRGRRRFYRDFWAIRDVDLDIYRGETVGIVGRNGSGKSTLLQLICNTLTPTSGELDVNGRVAALLELGSGFNPEFTGRENVYLNAAIVGLSRDKIDERFDRIAVFAGIGDFIHQPLKTYSSGMYARLAFAVAINVDPDILVVDEVLSVGDEAFQRKCFARISEIKEGGCTILFVSHSASAVIELCDWAVLIDGGEVLVTDAPKKVIGYYHRLIFAPPQRQEHARRMLLEGRGDELLDQSLGGENQEMPEDDVGSFDPHLRSESTIAYESRGATIKDVYISTESGRRVNVLEQRRVYEIRYRVAFTHDAAAVGFGTMIKTLHGVELGGSATDGTSEMLDFVSAGDVIDVRHRFECNLLPGAYFFNAGCTGSIDGDRVFLHRLLDVGMFRVLPNGKSSGTGCVDFRFGSRAHRTATATISLPHMEA